MKKSTASGLCLFLSGLSFLTSAEEIVLYRNDFQSPDSMARFVNSHKTSEMPPSTRLAFRGSEDGPDGNNYFFRGMNQAFGTSVTLDRFYTVDKNTRTVEIMLKVRGNAEAAPLCVVLSSLAVPVFPFPWSSGTGEGFGARGYRHANATNSLFYYKNSKEPNIYTEKKPFIKSVFQWHSWHIVYNHPAKMISLFVEKSGTPVLIYENVDMTAYVFRSIWFAGHLNYGCDYDDVKVIATADAGERAKKAE